METLSIWLVDVIEWKRVVYILTDGIIINAFQTLPVSNNIYLGCSQIILSIWNLSKVSPHIANSFTWSNNAYYYSYIMTTGGAVSWIADCKIKSRFICQDGSIWVLQNNINILNLIYWILTVWLVEQQRQLLINHPLLLLLLHLLLLVRQL